MHLRLCIHLQTKPLDRLHDTLCKVIHCSMGDGVFRTISRESHLSLSHWRSVLSVSFLGRRLDCHPMDPAGSSESPESGVILHGCLLHTSGEMLDGGRT